MAGSVGEVTVLGLFVSCGELSVLCGALSTISLLLRVNPQYHPARGRQTAVTTHTKPSKVPNALRVDYKHRIITYRWRETEKHGGNIDGTVTEKSPRVSVEVMTLSKKGMKERKGRREVSREGCWEGGKTDRLEK